KHDSRETEYRAALRPHAQEAAQDVTRCEKERTQEECLDERKAERKPEHQVQRDNADLQHDEQHQTVRLKRMEERPEHEVEGRVQDETVRVAEGSSNRREHRRRRRIGECAEAAVPMLQEEIDEIRIDPVAEPPRPECPASELA